MMQQARNFLTSSDVAKRFNVPAWKVRRIFERGIIPDFPRFGSYRVFNESDMVAIEAALRTAGYLPTKQAQ